MQLQPVRAMPVRGESMTCERCRRDTSGYDLHDYCARCGKNLCAVCMGNGCCGDTPAASGMDRFCLCERHRYGRLPDTKGCR